MKSIESEKTNTESVWQFNEQSFKFKHAPRDNFCQHVNYQQQKIQHYIY